MKLFLLFFLSFFILYAQDQNSSGEESSFIDKTHDEISSQVQSWGARIDDMVLGIYDFFDDENKTNPFLLDTNNSNKKDADFSFIVPVSIKTENNNSDVNTSRVILKNMNDINTSKDNNMSVFMKLFPLGNNQDKDLSVREAQNSFFVYECMDMDINNTSALTQEHYEEIPLLEIKKNKRDEHSIDEFFLTRKLLEERDRSYIRVSFLQPWQSLGADTFRFNVTARVHLTRSRKRLKLFIEEFNNDSAKNIGKIDEDNSPSIGLEKSTKEFFGIEPRYSIGFRGIDPFVRARYTFETDLGRWNFKPVQTFQYSIKDEFSESTELFLDTPTSERTLFRFVIDRGTNSNDLGMHYDGFIQWFFTPRKNAGLSFNLGANGSTKYENTIQSDPLVIQEENRVFNYLFLMRWRENIWKKWLFYEVGPGINYHEQYDYRPNYTVFFGIDMFFGHI